MPMCANCRGGTWVSKLFDRLNMSLDTHVGQTQLWNQRTYAKQNSCSCCQEKTNKFCAKVKNFDRRCLERVCYYSENFIF